MKFLGQINNDKDLVNKEYVDSEIGSVRDDIPNPEDFVKDTEAGINAVIDRLNTKTASSASLTSGYVVSNPTGATKNNGKLSFENLWTIIKGQISSVLGLTSTSYSGTANAAVKDNGGNVITSTYIKAVTVDPNNPKKFILTKGDGTSTSYFETKDTTYTSKPAASGGTAVSLVTTGEKYTWNNKANNTDIPDVIDNVTSTDAADALSARQGKLLNDRINNLESRGRFLALWDCTTGKPTSEPQSYPYVYRTGDWFRISKVGTTNYIPTGTQYTGSASTTTTTETLKAGDCYWYDGTSWKLEVNHVEIPVSDVRVKNSQGTSSVVSGGVATIDLTTKADTSVVNAHTGNTAIHVTADDKSNWNGKYELPQGGIPLADLSPGVANSFVQKSQGSSKAGQFLVVGSDGNVTTQSFSTWSGGNF